MRILFGNRRRDIVPAQLAASLEAARNQWIALEGNHAIAHAGTLVELLARVRASKANLAAVFFIPADGFSSLRIG